MRKEDIDIVAKVVTGIVACIVVGSVVFTEISHAQSPATIDTSKPAVEAPPAPLMGHLLRPNTQWLDDYSDKPVKEVALYYTVRQLIDAANRQQQEIENLKVANKNLTIDVTALKAMLHGINTTLGEDVPAGDPNSQ